MKKGALLPIYGLVGLILAVILSISTPAKTQTINSTSSFIYPAQGILSRGFRKYQHEGIDIAGASGTPIYAAAAGKVIKAGWDDWGLGNAITIQHADGRVTVYGHSRRLLVNLGQQINQGQIIAEMGSTGNSSGPHLHFEIHTNKRTAVDPIAFLPSQNTATVNTTQIATCFGTTLITGETKNARVKVCQENGQLFYIGELKQNPNQPVKLPASSISNSKYRAENGSFSYFVTPQGVEIWRNGRRFRNDIFYTNQS